MSENISFYENMVDRNNKALISRVHTTKLAQARPSLGPDVFCVHRTKDKVGKAQDSTRVIAQNVTNKHD